MHGNNIYAPLLTYIAQNINKIIRNKHEVCIYARTLGNIYSIILSEYNKKILHFACINKIVRRTLFPRLCDQQAPEGRVEVRKTRGAVQSVA